MTFINILVEKKASLSVALSRILTVLAIIECAYRLINNSWGCPKPAENMQPPLFSNIMSFWFSEWQARIGVNANRKVGIDT
jgi:hypothetical protein